MSINNQSAGFFLDNWHVDPRSGKLRLTDNAPWWQFWKSDQSSAETRIEPLPMRVLLELVAKEGEYISKADLIDSVWQSRPVTDDVLTHAIHAIRSALGDSARSPRFIETRHAVGYRLLPDVFRAQKTRRAPLPSLKVAAALGLAVAVLFIANTVRLKLSDLSPEPGNGPLTIAVLPFSDHSLATSANYLPMAMTESLILSLSRQTELRVISRTSVNQFTGTQLSAGEIADRLGADLLVEGSIQVAGDELRVVAQLINPRQDAHLWAEDYDRPLTDTLALQQELASSIAREIGLVVAQPGLRSYALPDQDLSQFLQARYLLTQETPEAAAEAFGLFSVLMEGHPDFAAARLGAAQAQFLRFKLYSQGIDALESALQLAREAEEMTGASPESQRLIGQALLFRDWDFAAAHKAYARALEMNPSDSVTRRRLAWLLVAEQKYAEASQEIKEIRLLDPIFYESSELATLLLYSGNYEGALTELERLRQARPLKAHEFRTLAMAHLAVGDEDIARQALLSMLHEGGTPVDSNQFELDDLSINALCELIIQESLFTSPIGNATFLSIMGKSDLAIANLKLAYDQRDPHLIFLGAMPSLNNLHSHPEFVHLLSEIGLGPERRPESIESRMASAIIRIPQENPQDSSID